MTYHYHGIDAEESILIKSLPNAKTWALPNLFCIIKTGIGLPFKTSINKLYHNVGVLMINDLFQLNLAKFIFKLHHKMSSNNAHVENIALVTALHNHHTR